MKKLYTIILTTLMLVATHVIAQEFSTQLIFTNAIGQTDTLVVGTDNNATMGIDNEFGEIDIKSQPFGEFEVRAADYSNEGCEYAARYLEPATYSQDMTNLHSKKMIVPPFCWGTNFWDYGFLIIFKNEEFPVTITWDSAQFQDPCRINSRLTDWCIEGWWDAVYGYEHPPTHPADSNTTEFDYTALRYQDEHGDTLHMLFMAFAHPDAFIVGVEEPHPENDKLNIYPNPARDYIEISLPENREQNDATIKIFDMMGRQVTEQIFHPAETKCRLQTQDWPAGIYSVQLLNQNKIVGKGRFSVK